MIKKQKVFIPTDTSNYNEGYKTQFELCDNIKSIGWYNGEKREHLGATHWLKEQEGYFFTEDQMQQFIKDSRNSLIHSVTKYIQSLNIKQSMITELKQTNLIAVEVPKYASDFFLIKPANYFHINYELPEYHSGVALFYNDFGGKCNYPTKIKILGEVTKDKIGFNVEPYAEKEMNGFYKNYSWDGSGRYYGYLTPYDSFRSLLAINGLYFENPIKVSGKHIVGTITKLAQDWQSFEDKLIKGKLLILEKI